MAQAAVIRGSLALNTASGAPPDTSFTFVATSGVLAAGTYTVTLVSGASGIKDASGVELDGTDSGIPGNNYVTTFTVAATPSVVLSIPDFAARTEQRRQHPAAQRHRQRHSDHAHRRRQLDGMRPST